MKDFKEPFDGVEERSELDREWFACVLGRGAMTVNGGTEAVAGTGTGVGFNGSAIPTACPLYHWSVYEVRD